MFIEVLPKIGGPPLRMEVAQVVVRNDVGTPVMVAGEYGPRGTIRVSHGQDADFNQTLRAFGYHGPTVVIESVKLGSPAGARAIAGPGI